MLIQQKANAVLNLAFGVIIFSVWCAFRQRSGGGATGVKDTAGI